jgi:diguanylate cyclase (GGDEF)-like protein
LIVPASPSQLRAPAVQRRQKILLIDDARPVHAFVASRLADEAVEILSAYDGESGMAMARSARPDMVLLDVELSDAAHDGLDVCRRLKQDPQTSDPPIILLVGSMSMQDKLHALDLGAMDYLSKPFDPAELRARVRSGLRQKALMDLLAGRAMIDGLTGLWNRSYFAKVADAGISLARRSSLPAACVLVDLDAFASLNQRFGHAVADEVIVRVARLLDGQSREEDTVCRWDGAGFAIFVPNAASAQAAAMARRMQKLVEVEPVIRAGGSDFHVTCSLGVADLAGGAGSAGELIAAASSALGDAKRAGGNRLVIARSALPVVC